MHVSPAKHSYGSVTDGRTDRQTDRQTDGRTDRQTDDEQSDHYVSLCFAGDTKTLLTPCPSQPLVHHRIQVTITKLTPHPLHTTSTLSSLVPHLTSYSSRSQHLSNLHAPCNDRSPTPPPPPWFFYTPPPPAPHAQPLVPHPTPVWSRSQHLSNLHAPCNDRSPNVEMIPVTRSIICLIGFNTRKGKHLQVPPSFSDFYWDSQSHWYVTKRRPIAHSERGTSATHSRVSRAVTIQIIVVLDLRRSRCILQFQSCCITKFSAFYYRLWNILKYTNYLLVLNILKYTDYIRLAVGCFNLFCDHELSVRPSLTFHIFDFSKTVEQNLTNLNMKQDISVLYQICVFGADRKTKIAAMASDWLRVRHFRLLLSNCRTKFIKTSQEVRSQSPPINFVFFCFLSVFFFFEGVEKTKHNHPGRSVNKHGTLYSGTRYMWPFDMFGPIVFIRVTHNASATDSSKTTVENVKVKVKRIFIFVSLSKQFR